MYILHISISNGFMLPSINTYWDLGSRVSFSNAYGFEGRTAVIETNEGQGRIWGKGHRCGAKMNKSNQDNIVWRVTGIGNNLLVCKFLWLPLENVYCGDVEKRTNVKYITCRAWYTVCLIFYIYVPVIEWPFIWRRSCKNKNNNVRTWSWFVIKTHLISSFQTGSSWKTCWIALWIRALLLPYIQRHLKLVNTGYLIYDKTAVEQIIIYECHTAVS